MYSLRIQISRMAKFANVVVTRGSPHAFCRATTSTGQRLLVLRFAGMPKRSLAATVVAVLSVLLAASARAQTWPQFRGSSFGVAADSDTPPTRLGIDDNLVWKTYVPHGASSPVIWEDDLFITGVDGHRLSTFALRRSDGELLWERHIDVERFEPMYSEMATPAAATPATDGTRVYVYFGSFGLVAYDFDGKEAWRKPMPTAVTEFGSGTSPVLHGRLLLLNRDQDDNGSVLAVDSETGATVWERERIGFDESHGTPVVWGYAGRTVVVMSGSFRLKAYDVATGEDVWFARGLPSLICTTPVVANGMLYAAAWGTGGESSPLPAFEQVLAGLDDDKSGALTRDEVPDGSGLSDFFDWFDTSDDGEVSEPEYTVRIHRMNQGNNALVAIRPGGTGDVTDTHTAWRQTKSIPYISSPLYYRGTIFLMKEGGVLSAFDADTGDERYPRRRLADTGDYYASPAAANGHLYVSSMNGTVTVLRVGETLDVVSENDLGAAIMGSPAFAADTLYVRAGDRLYAFADTRE